MIPEKLLIYVVTRLIEEGTDLLIEKLEQIEEDATKIVPNGDDLPSVCLVGFGRCGTNICDNVRDILLASRLEDDGTTNEQSLVNSMFRWIVREQRDANAFIKVSSEPMILAIDLDSNTFQKYSGKPTLYERFVPVELDWLGGAGNVQIIGEFQARRLLTVQPETVESSNWKSVFSYLIDSAALDINPARVYFFVFSTGGGTGSGMCTEFGFAQRAATRTRQMDVKQIGDENVLQRAPVFSCAVGILPEIPDRASVKEAVHLNSGRLLCRFLAMMGGSTIQSEEAKVILPWNCLVLVSNESVISKLRSSSSDLPASEFEKITNLFVAKHLFNLWAAQITADDIPDEDWEAFGIASGDRLRLEATDLLSSLYGINAIAFDQGIPEKNENCLSELFLSSLQPTEVVNAGGTDIVRGISVLPGQIETYSEYFNGTQQDVASNLSEIPMFAKAHSTLCIIAIPESYHPTTRDLAGLKKLCSTIFRNAGIHRYSLVRSVTSDVAVTTFISGNSVMLADECLALYLAYIRRCFSKSDQDSLRIEELILTLVSNASTTDKAESLWEDSLQELSELLNEFEDLDQFTAPPFYDVKDSHVVPFQKNGTCDIEELRVHKSDVLASLQSIQKTLEFGQLQHRVPTLLSPPKKTPSSKKAGKKKKKTSKKA